MRISVFVLGIIAIIQSVLIIQMISDIVEAFSTVTITQRVTQQHMRDIEERLQLIEGTR